MSCTISTTLFWFLCLFTFYTMTKLTSGELSDDPTTWPGHLQPLGSGKKWQQLETLDRFPTPHEFYTKYVQPSVPVIFKGAALDYPAIKLWTDRFLLSLPETNTEKIFIERAKKEVRTKPGFESTFANFLRAYNKSDIYMVAGVPVYLRKYIPLPESLGCNTLIDELVDTVMWFSSGGTKSVLHNDDVDNINCIYRGRKELLFIDFLKYRNTVKLDHSERGYSAVDVDSVDFTKYPELHDVEYYFANTTAGDCLFIPYKWFHQVNSFDANLAVNVWFNHRSKLDTSPEKCGNPNPQSIADVTFETDVVGDAVYEIDRDAFNIFSQYMKDNKGLTFEEFEKHFKNDSSLLPMIEFWTEECKELTGELFSLMDLDKDALLSKDDLEGLAALGEKDAPETDEIDFIMQEFSDIMTEQQAIVAENALKKLKVADSIEKPKEEL